MTENGDCVIIKVEADPQNISVDGSNSSVPTGGAFLIFSRIDKSIRLGMKQAGAKYYSQNYLDDMDEFELKPGWRYQIEALRVLINHGFSLSIREEKIASIKELDEMFSAATLKSYYKKQKHLAQEKKRAKIQQSELNRLERERKGSEYAQWKENRISGLILTNAGHSGENVLWDNLAYFDENTPGIWYTTGDHWYLGKTYDDIEVYKVSDGNAERYYAPQSVVDRWRELYFKNLVANSKGSEMIAARKLLTRAALFGDVDVPIRFIERHDVDY